LYVAANSALVGGYRMKAGMLLGWMNVTNGLQGSLAWVKQPVAGDTYYPAGITHEFIPLTSPYVVPTNAANRIIELTDGSNGVVVLSGGNLTGGLTNLATLLSSGKFITAPTNTAGQTNKLKLSIGLKTGKLTGFIYPDGVRSTRLSGALLQNANTGHGYFKAVTNTGTLLLQGR
jgi:hypothetical protein